MIAMTNIPYFDEPSAFFYYNINNRTKLILMSYLGVNYYNFDRGNAKIEMKYFKQVSWCDKRVP